jgi:ataxia telangiectasia mutated family protein
MVWVVLELYADCCVYVSNSAFRMISIGSYRQLHASIETPSANTQIEGPTAKRRKVENALASLLLSTESGANASRVLGIQVLIMIVGRHWARLAIDARNNLRRSMVSLLDDDKSVVQEWAFICLTGIATSHSANLQVDPMSQLSFETPSRHLAKRRSEAEDWETVWSHAIRKVSTASVCRTACLAAGALVELGKIPKTRYIKDIQSVLQNVDIQGPSHPYESVCAFLTTALRVARADVTLYGMDLEDKVLTWMAKWNVLDTGNRGKTKMDPHTPSDLLRLLSQVCRLPLPIIPDVTVNELLPDCAVVDRVLEEAKTQPIRQFILRARLPNKLEAKLNEPTLVLNKSSQEPGTLRFLEGRPRRVSLLLTSNLDILTRDWNHSDNSSSITPERLRKTIDLLVLALTFQGTLEVNDLRHDDACLIAISNLLAVVNAPLTNNAFSIPGQQLVWRGLAPLVEFNKSRANPWPILIRPNVQSGVRQDLLPVDLYAQDDTIFSSQAAVLSYVSSETQRMIWNFPEASCTTLIKKVC